MHDLLLILISMVLVVPLSKRLGLGSVIGYLVSGVMIGPHGFSLLSSGGREASELAEFGVIMMMLLLGLELNPRLLLKMAGPIFGLGSVQVLSTIAVFSLGAWVLGQPLSAALAVGMIASVSSTAIALQTLQEQGYAKSVGGERAFSVLLFQDLAVIPMLAVLPFLAVRELTSADASGASPTSTALLFLGAVVAVVGSGRFIVRPLFKLISRTRLRETFTALALLIVAASATLMHAVSLSPALGAFLAGVVLADSEYRHQIEADIEPFKGLLLGLFFITIGTTLNPELVIEAPLQIGALVAAIIGLKTALVYALGRGARMRAPESLLFAVSLAQGGEFAFVLIGQSRSLLPATLSASLTTSIALTMALAPLLIKLTIRRGMSRLDCQTPDPPRAPDLVDESMKDNPVLVVGIGRFGQTLIRFLRANGYPSTVLDIDSEQIEIMARFGIKTYFGDGSNLDLLRAAGLERTKALVLALDEPETTTRIVEQVRAQYPGLPIFARVFDRVHAYRLLHLGITEIAIETSGSALALGTCILERFGHREERAQARAQLFQRNNQRSIRELAKRYHEDDRETFIQASRQMSEQLEAIFRTDPDELSQGAYSDLQGPGARAAPEA